MIAPESQAIIASPDPVKLTQPDGAPITLRVRGDEHFHWFEDLAGYTVVLDQGRYVYAQLDGQGLLAPTAKEVGKVNPKTDGLAGDLRNSAGDHHRPSSQFSQTMGSRG